MPVLAYKTAGLLKQVLTLAYRGFGSIEKA